MVQLKKIRLGILLVAITASFSILSFARTYKTDIVPTDCIEFTLEEEDKLSAELIIDEKGLYSLKVASLSSSESSAPRIAITVSEGSKELYRFETKKPQLVDEDFNTEKFTFLLGLTEGNYKLEIKNLTRFSDVSFKIETVFTEEENIEDINNHSFGNATDLELNTKYFGSASMTDETDFYKFEMPYDGAAYIEMYSPEHKIFTLYDQAKNEIGSIGIEIEEADKIYELRSGLTKGTYYISVHPYDDYTSPLYTVKVLTSAGDIFEKEYNNTKEHAMSVKSGKEYQGSLFGTDDEDVYTFSLSEKSNITLDFTDTIASEDGHYSIWLTDGKNVIFSDDECGRVTKELPLDKGDYYLTVGGLGEARFTSMVYKVKVASDKGFAGAVSQEKPMEVVQFNDVSQEKWYYGELLEAKSLGLINGVGNNKYNPEENVTLAEIIAMASRIKNSKGGINTELESSSVGKWYNSYVTFAVNTGIIKIDDFEGFEEYATRAEVAYIFANLFGDVETEKNTIIPDVNMNTEYCDSIHKMYALGILKGGSDGLFRPEDKITRAEAAAILLRVHNS